MVSLTGDASGDGQPEDLAALAGRFGPDPAALRQDQVLGDGQAKARARRGPAAPGRVAVVAGPRRVDLVEALEHPRPVLGGDPGPVVADGEAELLPLHAGVHLDRRA